jgi:hypothetical protein
MSPASNQLVKPRDAVTAAMSLAQYLFFAGPESAERGWLLTATVQKAEPSQWFAIRSKNSTAYMLAGETGRFGKTLPAGVDAAALPVIDETGPAPTALREYMDSLAITISETHPDAAEKIKSIAKLAWQADNLAWLRGELNELLSSHGQKGSQVSDAEFAAALEKDTRHRYLHFEIPGALAATVLLLTRIACVAAPLNFIRLALDKPGALSIFNGPERFLLDVLKKFAMLDAGEAKIAAACAQLQDEAESFADKAEAATRFGDFYGAIFESVPLAYSAQQGFEFLADKGFGNPGHYRLLANVCEERVAPTYATMPLAFRDTMDWCELRLHRATIAEARKTGGDAAADMLADQYTKLSLLYPPFLRDFLLGKTDDLRFTAAGS